MSEQGERGKADNGFALGARRMLYQLEAGQEDAAAVDDHASEMCLCDWRFCSDRTASCIVVCPRTAAIPLQRLLDRKALSYPMKLSLVLFYPVSVASIRRTLVAASSKATIAYPVLFPGTIKGAMFPVRRTFTGVASEYVD